MLDWPPRPLSLGYTRTRLTGVVTGFRICVATQAAATIYGEGTRCAVIRIRVTSGCPHSPRNLCCIPLTPQRYRATCPGERKPLWPSAKISRRRGYMVEEGMASTIEIVELTPDDALSIADIHLTARAEAMPYLARAHTDDDTRDWFARTVGYSTIRLVGGPTGRTDRRLHAHRRRRPRSPLCPP